MTSDSRIPAQSTIHPGVVLPDGRTVYPPGWMWVLGFAVAGCEWAIEEMGSERFRAAMAQLETEARRDND